jgi:hypothetical protein
VDSRQELLEGCVCVGDVCDPKASKLLVNFAESMRRDADSLGLQTE